MPGEGERAVKFWAGQKDAGRRETMKIVADMNADVKGRAVEFMRWALCVAMAKGEPGLPYKIFETKFPMSRNLDMIRRQTISPLSTDASTSPIAGLNSLASGFIEYLRPLTVLGRLQGVKRVPFSISVPRQSGGATARWTGESRVKGISSLSFETVTLTASKIAAICVFSSELAKSSDPDAERLIRDDLVAAVAQLADQSFLDPSLAGSDVNPPSILFGSTEVVSSGTTYAAVASDFKRLVAALSGSNFISPAFVMKPSVAAALAALDPGNGLFKDVGPTGGRIMNIEVLTTASMPSDANSPSDNLVALIDGSEVLLAQGGVEVHSASNSTIELSDAPDSPPSASTTMVSLFQADLLGLRVEQLIRWAPRRAGISAYLSGLAI